MWIRRNRSEVNQRRAIIIPRYFNWMRFKGAWAQCVVYFYLIELRTNPPDFLIFYGNINCNGCCQMCRERGNEYERWRGLRWRYILFRKPQKILLLLLLQIYICLNIFIVIKFYINECRCLLYVVIYININNYLWV